MDVFMRNGLHIFLMICFVLVNVSPACKFISGTSLMELCGSVLSVKKVEVDPALAKFFASKDTDQQDENQSQTAQIDCSFCFAQQHMDFKPTNVVVLSGHKISSHKTLALVQNLVSAENVRAIARGPPAHLA